MEIEITEADDNDFDRKSTSLIEALVHAWGADLPDRFDRITEHYDHYDLHVNKDYQSGDPASIGNAFGRALAAHGWVIIGISSHYTEDDNADRVSISRIQDCTDRSTIYYSQGDEDKINFTEV